MFHPNPDNAPNTPKHIIHPEKPAAALIPPSPPNNEPKPAQQPAIQPTKQPLNNNTNCPAAIPLFPRIKFPTPPTPAKHKNCSPPAKALLLDMNNRDWLCH